MNTLLWILAVVLAVAFVASGTLKLSMQREDLIDRTPYVEDFPHWTIQAIGVLEILGAVGLLLPGILNVATILVPLAAAGLAITMVFAVLVHARRGDPTMTALPSMVLALLSVAVAWLRFGPYPL